ncbi:13021_t:CDS:2, partial [Funneliformis geosporum]
MTLVAPAVTPFKWIVDSIRELIQLQCDNHDDFEFVSNNHHEKYGEPYIAAGTSTDIDLILAGIIDPILMVILGIIDPILTVVVHGIIDHVLAVIQGIKDPVLEDTEGSHILHEGE